jgi:hypothetical protein
MNPPQVLERLQGISASGATVEFVSIDNGWSNDEFIDLAGSASFDIRISTNPGESFPGQQIRLELTTGSIIYHPLAGEVPPNSGVDDFWPAAKYTTFVAAGADLRAPGVTGPLVLGPSDSLGGPVRTHCFSRNCLTSLGAPC